MPYAAHACEFYIGFEKIGKMENDMETLQSLEYDEERLKQFIHRALYSTNLPPEYKPGRDINKAAFADALIGLFIEQAENKYENKPEALDAALAQVAFAISSLQGDTPDELNNQFQQLSDQGLSRKYPREYALDVAGAGARYFRDGLDRPFPLKKGPPRKIERIEKVYDYEEFKHLGDFIRRLYEEERITSGEAQALLLLFRQAPSTAPKSTQVKIVLAAEARLKAQLRRTVALQSHVGEKLEDQTLAKGADFVKKILANPTLMLEDNRVLSSLARGEAMRDESLEPKEAYESVLGHIGYTLDKVYPQKNSLYADLI